MSAKGALALVGSPRARSTSKVLAEELLAGMAASGWETEAITIRQALRKPEDWEELLTSYGEADLVALVFPLYVDCLPAPVILALERLASLPARPAKGLVAIVNCGFAEARHNDAALAICQRFAEETGLEWRGGISIGGGGMISGTPLAKVGSVARGLRQAFSDAATALAEEHAISEETLARCRKRLIPAWLYRLIANRGMKKDARKHGVLQTVAAQPYLAESRDRS
jgi:multimeric flavodoxin WrbA